jgi:hypothetical protein
MINLLVRKRNNNNNNKNNKSRIKKQKPYNLLLEIKRTTISLDKYIEASNDNKCLIIINNLLFSENGRFE